MPPGSKREAAGGVIDDLNRDQESLSVRVATRDVFTAMCWASLRSAPPCNMPTLRLLVWNNVRASRA